MATIDSNNSFWTRRLLRFKDFGQLFPARLSGNDDGPQTVRLEIEDINLSRLDNSIYVAALVLVTGKYSAKDEILIAQVDDDASPAFYAFEIAHDLSSDSFISNIDREMKALSEHLPYFFEGVANILELNLESVFQICVSTSGNNNQRKSECVEGITLLIKRNNEENHLILSYNGRKFPRYWIEQFGNHFLKALRFLVARTDQQIGDLDLLSPEEKRQVAVDFNQTERVYPSNKTLHGLVEDAAAANDSSAAVRFADQELTYAELNNQANRLAHFLIDRLRVQIGDRVGVLARRSEKMVIALLGIMKAGAAYVPINPKHPWATVNYMIENAGINVLLVDTDSISQAATFAGDLFILDLELDRLNTPKTNPDFNLQTHDLAYVIYTSGSTGRPKGVAVEHGAIVNTIFWRNEYYGFDADDVNLQMPSFAFDSSVLDIFCVLCAGGELVIPHEELRLDAQYLKKIILDSGVTRMILTPSYYRVLMKDLEVSPTLRSITVAGEPTTVELVDEHSRRMPNVTLFNEYGPTENAVCSTACILQPGAKTVPIGKPVSNVKVFILDERMKLSPPCAPGEIFLGGVGLARGYLNQEALTAERFIPSPTPDIYDGRLYRTGDWGYWRHDGTLEFVGRIDNQVKVHGFRIELEEIESHLSHHPNVMNAAVICKGEGGDKYLAAYVAANSLEATDLRKHLSSQLPYYMVPEIISVLPELPLTFNGKVDRNFFKNLNDRAETGGPDVMGDEAESALASICSDLLQRARLGATDNLFDHGLNSLRVMELVSRIRNELQVEVSLLDVYSFPSIKLLARRIGGPLWKAEAKTMKSSI